MFLAIRNADHTLTNRPHRGARPGYLVQGDRNGFKLRKSLWGLSEPEQERFVAALYAMMDPEASPDTACSEYCRLAGLYDYPGSGTTTNPQTVPPPSLPPLPLLDAPGFVSGTQSPWQRRCPGRATRSMDND